MSSYVSTRLLVADADPDTIELYRASLTGYEVIASADGREALAKALVHPPSLVITELHLPFIDGVALCDILRRDRSTTDLPILVVTSESRPTEWERARYAGADDVLVKPTTRDVVLRHVRALLSTSVTDRAHRMVQTAGQQFDKSAAFLESRPHTPLVRAHQRFRTTTPPLSPPTLICPSCDRPLIYVLSQIGGVNERFTEQWDSFSCRCGEWYQYRQRTKRMRVLRPDEQESIRTLKEAM